MSQQHGDAAILDGGRLYTGEERHLTEYRDPEGIWRPLPAPGAAPATGMLRRTVRQRRVQETAATGMVAYYWETQR